MLDSIGHWPRPQLSIRPRYRRPIGLTHTLNPPPPVSPHANGRRRTEPSLTFHGSRRDTTVRRIAESVRHAPSVLADTGQVNGKAFERPEEAGMDLYVAVSRDESYPQRCYDDRPKSVMEKSSKVVRDPRLLAVRETLKTEAGRKLCAQRKQTVEPTLGIIRGIMGFRQFPLRGLDKVNGEGGLVCLA